MPVWYREEPDENGDAVEIFRGTVWEMAKKLDQTQCDLAELKAFLAHVRETVGDECDCNFSRVDMEVDDPCIFCAVRAAWEANKEE